MPGAGTQDLRDFIRDLGKMDPELRREMRPMLRTSAEKPLQQARLNASWSTRIPRATKVSVSLAAKKAGVSIRTSRKLAPHARPYEHGGDAGRFRHPVFGNRNVWVYEPARPFLARAAEPWLKDADENIGKVVDLVSARFEFK
jgi:hypothetical protein